jgi:hypothetical protein
VNAPVLNARANTAVVIARSLMPNARPADVIDLAHARFRLELTPAEANAALAKAGA